MAKEIEKNHVADILQTWVVDKICIYESLLKPTGSDYRMIDEVQLGHGNI